MGGAHRFDRNGEEEAAAADGEEKEGGRVPGASAVQSGKRGKHKEEGVEAMCKIEEAD